MPSEVRSPRALRDVQSSFGLLSRQKDLVINKARNVPANYCDFQCACFSSYATSETPLWPQRTHADLLSPGPGLESGQGFPGHDDRGEAPTSRGDYARHERLPLNRDAQCDHAEGFAREMPETRLVRIKSAGHIPISL
jgi:hypothetical protein